MRISKDSADTSAVAQSRIASGNAGCIWEPAMIELWKVPAKEIGDAHEPDNR
jgi:hypothetical protein